jgi:hypothetical protein
MMPKTMSQGVISSLQSAGHPFLEAKARRRKVRRQKERSEARQFVSGAKDASSDNQLQAVIKAKKDKKSQKTAVMVTHVNDSESGWTRVGAMNKHRHDNTSSGINSGSLSKLSESLASTNYVPRTRIARAIAAAEDDWSVSEDDDSEDSDVSMNDEAPSDVTVSEVSSNSIVHETHSEKLYVDDVPLLAKPSDDLSFKAQEILDTPVVYDYASDVESNDSDFKETWKECPDEEMVWQARPGEEDFDSMTDHSQIKVLEEMDVESGEQYTAGERVAKESRSFFEDEERKDKIEEIRDCVLKDVTESICVSTIIGPSTIVEESRCLKRKKKKKKQQGGCAGLETKEPGEAGQEKLKFN